MFDPAGPVLGIDPGVSRCGYGAVVRDAGRLRATACGVIRTAPGDPLPERLLALDDELAALVRQLRPSALAVERVLFQNNARTAISVGQASGLALVAAARAGIPVVQYSPNEVKLAVTGDGRADKLAVQTMVTRLLSLREIPKPADAADALACVATTAGRGCSIGFRLDRLVARCVLERTLSGEVLVEVAGVGYRVLVPVGAIPELEPGANVFLFTHQHVRDDALVLYGFLTCDERDTFEALITASGVGPKLALAILSVHSPPSLRRCLAEDDLDSLVAVPGVGKRTAQRLLVDLKARLEMPDVDLTAVAGGAAPNARAEVRDALVGLGYGNDEVRDVFGQLGEDGTVEELLREALRLLAGRK